MAGAGKNADRKLIHRTGSLWFGDADVWTNEGQITQTMKSMDEMGLPYERLSIRAIEQRFGFTHFDANYEGFLQRDGGVIDVKGTLSTLYALASELNVSFAFGQEVVALEPDSTGVTVIGAEQRFRARKVLVASGPGSKKLVGQLDIDLALSTYEMACISMLRSERTTANDPFWFAFQQPVASDSNLFYGFPPIPGRLTVLTASAPILKSTRSVTRMARAIVPTRCTSNVHWSSPSGTCRSSPPTVNITPAVAWPCYPPIPSGSSTWIAPVVAATAARTWWCLRGDGHSNLRH